jgi:hypothetical protein
MSNAPKVERSNPLLVRVLLLMSMATMPVCGGGFLAVAWATADTSHRLPELVSSSVYPLADGGVLLVQHNYDRSELRARLTDERGAVRFDRVVLRDARLRGPSAIYQGHPEYLVLALRQDWAYAELTSFVLVLRRRDGTTASSGFAPSELSRHTRVIGERLVSVDDDVAPQRVSWIDLDAANTPPESAVVCAAGRLFTTRTRMLIYNGATNSHCPGMLLDESRVVRDDFGLGAWNQREAWPIAMQPGADRLLVRTPTAVESWALDAEPRPELVVEVPEGISELAFWGMYEGRLVFVGYDGNRRVEDPPVTLLQVDPAEHRIVAQQNLGHFVFDDRPSASRELPRFAALESLGERSTFQLVMIDLSTNTEAWRSPVATYEQGPKEMWLTAARNGTFVVEQTIVGDHDEPSVLIARFDPETGKLDRVVDVPRGRLDMLNPVMNDRVFALTLGRDAIESEQWLLLSTTTLEITDSSLSNEERPEHVVEARADFLHRVELPEPAR